MLRDSKFDESLKILNSRPSDFYFKNFSYNKKVQILKTFLKNIDKKFDSKNFEGLYCKLKKVFIKEYQKQSLIWKISRAPQLDGTWRKIVSVVTQVPLTQI